MNKANKIELVLICLAVAVAALAARALPTQLPLGEIALVASALLLAQGLARDLWLKYGRRSGSDLCAIPADRSAGSEVRPPATCMCVESSLGIFGIVAGALALLSGASHSVSLPVYFWPVLVLGVGLLGFAMKSLVIDWKARRIRIETDHSAVRFGK